MQESVMELVHAVLFNPATSVELGVSALLATIAFVLTLNGIGSALSLPMAQTGRSIVVFVITAAANLGVVAIVNEFFAPPGWVLMAAAAVVVLAVAVPAVCLVQKGTYMNGLFAMVISLVAAVVVALAVHTVFGAIGQGGKSVGKELKRKGAIEKAIGDR